MGEGCFDTFEYDIGRRRTGALLTREDGRRSTQTLVTGALFFSKVPRQASHYREPISRKTWCAQASRGRATTLLQSLRRAAAARLSGAWMAVAGRGSRAHCSQRSSPRAKHSRGLRFRQTLHLDQPATARFQSKWEAWRKPTSAESARAWLSSTRRSTSSSFSLYNPCGCRRSCSQAWRVESSKPHSFAALRWPMPSFLRASMIRRP